MSKRTEVATPDDLVRDALVPEPLEFWRDISGAYRLLFDKLPWRTVIDVRDGFVLGPKFMVDHASGILTIEDQGKTVVYLRRSFDANGRWICNLRR